MFARSYIQLSLNLSLIRIEKFRAIKVEDMIRLWSELWNVARSMSTASAEGRRCEAVEKSDELEKSQEEAWKLCRRDLEVVCEKYEYSRSSLPDRDDNHFNGKSRLGYGDSHGIGSDAVHLCVAIQPISLQLNVDGLREHQLWGVGNSIRSCYCV